MTARDAPAALVAIVGATAVGKTALTMALAAEFDAEIISADSRQVFCGLDIGTAKPTKAERMQVPHHVIDVAPADYTSFSLAVWREACGQCAAGARCTTETAMARGRDRTIYSINSGRP